MEHPPQSALLSESQMAMFVDYDELAMGQADFDDQNNAICTEDYFVPSIRHAEYLIVAGLEQVVHDILNLRFTDAGLNWLQDSKLPRRLIAHEKLSRLEALIPCKGPTWSNGYNSGSHPRPESLHQGHRIEFDKQKYYRILHFGE